MSSLHDLQSYVKRHPDDRAQRWRLAKKLYMAGEFDKALPHLRVLRKQWHSKLNVVRYLAASHYRLGNHNDAIRVLERALEKWPDEVPIRQQLAHVLEAAGLHSAATRAWQEVLTRQPDHPFARDALQSLSDRHSAAAAPPPAMPEAGRKCPNCGAENGDEFERCWQCHSTLVADAEPESAAAPKSGPKPVLIDLQDHTAVTIASVVIGIMGIIVSAYFIGEAWSTTKTPPASRPTVASVHGVLATGLITLRLAIALVLAIACPIALYIAALVTRTPMPSIGTIAAVGLAIAASAVAATLLPLPVLMFAPALLAVAIFGLVMWLFSPRYVRGAAIAFAQCAVVFGLSAATAHQTEGEVFLNEIPDIVKFGASHDAKGHRGRIDLPPSALPVEYTFQFASTGSTWLNEHAALVRIDAGTDDPSQRMDVELFEYEESLDYYWGDPVIVPFNAQLGRPYRLVLDGKTVPSNAAGAIIGVLPVEIHTATAAASE